MAMRGKAEMFVGKNTMVRFVIKKFAEEHKNHALVALADARALFGLLIDIFDHLEGTIGHEFRSQGRDILAERAFAADDTARAARQQVI